jgi:RNA polymerase sigma factor for flagellar operon FliA
MLDEIRRSDWTPRSVHRKSREAAEVIRKFEQTTGRDANDKEVAEELGQTLEAYHTLLSNIHSVSLLNLDDFIRSEENEIMGRRSFQEKIVSDDDPSENVSKNELKSVLAQAIQNLSEKEQKVISLYYYNDLTLKEIGKVMDLTESRICQIHTQTLLKLKTRLRRYYEA